MKKILSVFICLMMLSSTAFAQIGLESLWNNVFDDSDNTIRVQLSGSGTVDRITADSVVSKAITADSVYSGSYLGPLSVSQNSDTVAISHDGTDAYFKTSDGVFIFQTDEGTNTDSILRVLGKGTGSAYLQVRDGSNSTMNTNISQVDGIFNIQGGSNVTETVFNDLGSNVDFRVESDTLPYAFEVDGATGDVRGTNSAISNQHSEIGLMLALLQTPVAIVGFTGTGATGATEKGYENGNGRVWTYSGGLATDKIFKGQTYVYSFDGTDSYLSTPDTADMSFGDGSNDVAFSVGGWVEVVNTAGNQRIICKSTGSPNSSEWALFLDASEKLYLITYDLSVPKTTYRATDVALSVGWHHVVAVYNSTGGATNHNGTTLYVDGVAVASSATNDAGYVAMENATVVPQIGRDSAGNYFAGDMGRLFVHPAALSAAEVWLQYENTRGFYNQ